MAGVKTTTVPEADHDMRIDRWFKREYPGLSHVRLQKLLRRGEVRVDGKRAKAGDRLQTGQTVRIPPLDAERDGTDSHRPPGEAAPARPRAAPKPLTGAERAWVDAMVLYRDESVIVLNKPPGLAVQGGQKVDRHLDGMLDALTGDAAERPRLVHRLDQDTSGLLLLARTAPAARALTQAFRSRDCHKLYWALVAGLPQPIAGRIDQPLAKGAVGKARAVDPQDPEGKRAVTGFATVDVAGKKVAWLALEPLTGRTHQLRVHMTVLGTPIVGDGKYGGRAAFLREVGAAEQLHLHARRLRLPHPDRGEIDIVAPLPPVLHSSWQALGFEPTDTYAADSFPSERQVEDSAAVRTAQKI